MLNVFFWGLRLYFTFFPRRFVVSERVSQVLVSSTSNELLHRFGTWDASDLKDWRLVIQQGFNRYLLGIQLFSLRNRGQQTSANSTNILRLSYLSSALFWGLNGHDPRWWFQICLYFHLENWEDVQFDEHIFQIRVETTNQMNIE